MHNNTATRNLSIMLGRIALLASIGAIISNSTAHMILQNPVPYGLPTLDNSPLDDSGLDFPCKLRAGVYDLTLMNYWAAGEKKTISFTGSAVHGGGSCQFSVTNDLQPTKGSHWKVLHSVVGGCPASAIGNLPGGSEGHGAATFDIMLPKELPSGTYTFAWTWFNKEGNREMYMNCAPITIHGGANDTTFLGTLPDMFVANLPRDACSTVEGFDYAFPDPGVSVVTGVQAKIATSLTGPGCASVTALGAGIEASHSPQSPSYNPTHQNGAEDMYQESTAPVASNQSVSTANLKGDVAVSATSTLNSQLHVAHNTPLSANQYWEPAETPTAIISASTAACMRCNLEGDILCLDEHHFGICNQGCALPQSLAAGTFCQDGQIL